LLKLLSPGPHLAHISFANIMGPRSAASYARSRMGPSSF